MRGFICNMSLGCVRGGGKGRGGGGGDLGGRMQLQGVLVGENGSIDIVNVHIGVPCE